MATTPVFLPGESPGTEVPGGLQSMGLQRVRHNWATKHSIADSFRGTGPECRQYTKVVGVVQNVTVLSCHLWWEKKSYSQISLDHFFFFQKSTYHWTQQWARSCANIRQEWKCSLPSISYCWQYFSSNISHRPFLLQSVTFLPVHLRSASMCRLLYCTTVLFKVLYYKMEIKIILCILILLCIIYVKTIKKLLQYSTT